MKKLSELRKSAPVSEPEQKPGFRANADGTRNYWDGPCWTRTTDKPADEKPKDYRIRHICKLCKLHDQVDGCYRLIDGVHAWVCDKCYAAQPYTGSVQTGQAYIDTAYGAIPFMASNVLKPRFERKADGHLGAVEEI